MNARRRAHAKWTEQDLKDLGEVLSEADSEMLLNLSRERDESRLVAIEAQLREAMAARRKRQ